MSSAVGMGLIGLGTISFAHIEGYRIAGDAVDIVAACDTDPATAKHVADHYSCSPYTDYRELLANPAVEAVDIMLPHSLHHEVAGAALRAKKHVLVEKPMAPSSAECRDLIEVARANDRTFTVAENTPFVDAYKAVEKLMEAGDLGELQVVRASISGTEVERLRDTTLWKGRRDGTVGGAIMDAGPHSFYLFKWLFGGIADVSAQSWKLVAESEVEDNAVMTGRLANGAVYSVDLSFTAEVPWGERLEIHGSEASVIVDQLADRPVVVYRGSFDFDGTPIAGVNRDVAWWKGASIAAGVVDFVTAIGDGRPPSVDPVDGLLAMHAVEAAYQSVADGGRPVAVEADLP